jgi:2-polyprenyl-3-methyl-5-hydroxy-6-metoxy-1,4-benzoquinol methylase
MSTLYIHDEITHNSSAAERVLPVLFSIFKPKSILDVGCGLGNWIEVAKKMGVEEVVGVDGSYVNRTLLKIDDKEFIEKDLTKPFDLNSKFDLAICLEVAEHLTETSADILIQSIVAHADVVMFSAAIPGQGGQNHINEQWPTYWQEIFEKYDYDMIDFFRPKIWNDNGIERWYRQNMFLVVKKGHSLSDQGSKEILSLVHPELLSAIIDQNNLKIQKLQAKNEKLAKRDLLGKAAKIFKGKNK